MALQEFYLAPGVDKSGSAYSDQQAFKFITGDSEASRIGHGRFVDSNWIRFIAGFPEKIGGYSQQNSGFAYEGTPRKILQMDLVGTASTLVQTDTHLYDGTTDVTPPCYLLTTNTTLTIGTTEGSSHVTITVTQPSVTGNLFVNVNQGAITGGLSILGYYPILSNTGTVITVDGPGIATSTTSAGISTILRYPNYLLGTNPFATTSGSSTVVVTDSNYSLAPSGGGADGQYVTFSGAATFNGVTISGEYVTFNATTHSYSITAATTATGNGSGGGSAVLVTYLMSTTGVSSATAAGNLVQYGAYALANWQNNLLGQSQEQTAIYVLGFAAGDPLGRAYPLHNSPSVVDLAFVTPEKYVVALSNKEFVISGRNLIVELGSSNLTYINWADQSDPTDWQPSATNTAELNLPVVGGNIWTAGVGVRDFVSLISTDKCVFQMSYTEDSFVYDISLAGDNCGAVGQQAMVSFDGVAYWVGNGDFWQWDGSVSPLPTDDVRDYFYRNVNISELSKVVVGVHALKKEIWIFYPSGSSTENDSYLIYHVDQKVFSLGQLGGFGRSAWGPQVPGANIMGPLTADTSGILWAMDTGTDEVTNSGTTAIDSWVTTSFVELSNGDTNLDLTGFILDTERQTGNLELTTLTQYYPQDTAVSTGPTTIASGTSRVDMRLDGRICAFKLESNAVGGDFRMGLCRMDIKPSGARR